MVVERARLMVVVVDRVMVTVTAAVEDTDDNQRKLD